MSSDSEHILGARTLEYTYLIDQFITSVDAYIPKGDDLGKLEKNLSGLLV